jgi:hypothetical protein
MTRSFNAEDANNYCSENAPKGISFYADLYDVFRKEGDDPIKIHCSAYERRQGKLQTTSRYRRLAPVGKGTRSLGRISELESREPKSQSRKPEYTKAAFHGKDLECRLMRSRAWKATMGKTCKDE